MELKCPHCGLTIVIHTEEDEEEAWEVEAANEEDDGE